MCFFGCPGRIGNAKVSTVPPRPPRFSLKRVRLTSSTVQGGGGAVKTLDNWRRPLAGGTLSAYPRLQIPTFSGYHVDPLLKKEVSTLKNKVFPKIQ